MQKLEDYIGHTLIGTAYTDGQRHEVEVVVLDATSTGGLMVRRTDGQKLSERVGTLEVHPIFTNEVRDVGDDTDYLAFGQTPFVGGVSGHLHVELDYDRLRTHGSV